MLDADGPRLIRSAANAGLRNTWSSTGIRYRLRLVPTVRRFGSLEMWRSSGARKAPVALGSHGSDAALASQVAMTSPRSYQ